jgi:putative Ig domain-containing protein/ricin-type beta-trefoil lectin protein
MKCMPFHVSWLAAGISIVGLAFGGAAAAGTTHSLEAHNLSARVINLHKDYQARLAHARPGRISGVLYARGKQPAAEATGATCTEPACPVTYNGGSVQHTPHVYLLLWGPNWSTDSGEEATASYLESFYQGLGVQPQDDWSITTSQYGDGTGHPTFKGIVYEGVWQDTSTPPYGVDQSELGAEADAFTSSEGITDLTDAQIVVATQSGTCPEGFDAPAVCGSESGDYCSWHSSSNEPFTNLPYLLDAGSTCGEDFVNPNGTYDGFSISGGHEYAETVTDPFPDSGWWDSKDPSGGEIADKCQWSPQSSDVSLSTGSFAMQPLWSNFADSCVMASPVGTVTVTSPGNQSTYQESLLSLQVSGTSSLNYPLSWAATGLPSGLTINSGSGLVSGQITAGPGTYSVRVSATAFTGASASASFSWMVKADVGVTVKNQSAGVCLNDHSYSITPGNQVVVWACNTKANEKFTHPSNQGELIVLGQCLTDPGHGGSGAEQVVDPCSGASNQLWYHNSKHEYVIQKNLLCLTDLNGSTVNGTAVDVTKCTGAKDQQWLGS